MPTKRLQVPIESYALIPSILALLLIGIDRSGLQWFYKFCLFGIVVVLVKWATCWALTTGLVIAALLIEHSLFLHPAVSFGAAVILGIRLVGRQDQLTEQGRFALFIGALYIVGLFAVLGHPTLRWITGLFVVAGFILTLFLLLARRLEFSEIFVNSFHYLVHDLGTGERNPNRARFTLHALYFFTVGAATWGQFSELLDYRVATLLHLALSVSVPAAFMAILNFPFHSVEYAVTAPLPLALPAPDNSRAIELAERQAKQDLAQLLAREREFFLHRPWDELSGAFTNSPITTLPSGEVMKAADHLFIGTSTKLVDGHKRISPVLLHRDILKDHIHILGGTGSGKTSLGITPIVTQIIRGHAVARLGQEARTEPEPLIILDLKGDAALFHSVRAEAKARGQEFLHFTVDSTKTSYYFNPFQTLRRHSMTPTAQAQQLLDALGMNHGESYGRSYFTRINRQALLEILRSESPQSLKELHQRLKDQKRRNEPAQELLAALEGLIDYPQLFTTKKQEMEQPESIIDFDRVLERNQVVYFLLTAPTQSISVREIGKLALYSLFMAAVQRYNAGKSKQAYLVIDEFQRLVGANLEHLVEQARGFSIGAILTNHNIAQLKTHDTNLWPLVNSNVRASFHFGSSDPEELQLLSDASGQILEELRSRSVTRGRGHSHGTGISEGHSIGISIGTMGPSLFEGESFSFSSSRSTSESESASETMTQVYRPRLRPEDLRAWFNREQNLALWVRRASGYSDSEGRPELVEGRYTMSKETYEERKRMPWPDDGFKPSFERDVTPSAEEKQRLNDTIDHNFDDSEAPPPPATSPSKSSPKPRRSKSL